MFYWYMTNICLAYDSTTDNKFQLSIIKAFPMHCEIIDTERVTKILTMLFTCIKTIHGYSRIMNHNSFLLDSLNIETDYVQHNSIRICFISVCFGF